MAFIKNNRFSDDDDDTRQARLALLSANIDLYAVLIAVAGDMLAWAQSAFDIWVDLCATAAREDGDIDEATQEYRIKYDDAHDYYIRAKALLKAILESFQDNDEAAEKYGVMRDTPRNVDALYRKIQQWKDQHDIYIAEADPRVIADEIVTEMMAKGDDFYTGWKFAITQKREAAEAYDAKQAEFKLGTKYLGLIYSLAVMVWGDEDPRLLELGFQTKSGIWTPGQPPLDWPDWPGPVEASAEQIDEGLVRLKYSGLNGGKTLRIDRLKQGDADYVLVTQGLPLDDPEEVMPFDDNHLDKKKYTYKLTPFNEAMEAGVPVLVEVTVS